MKEKQKIENLVENLESLEPRHGNKKTDFLNDPVIKKVLIKKFNEGVTIKAILETIKSSGYDISMATLRKWRIENNITKKTAKRKSIV